MNLTKVKQQLKEIHPESQLFENKNTYGEVTEVLCEIEPTSHHSEYSKVIAVIDRSKPHYHKATKETYKILKGSLKLFIEGDLIELEAGDEYEIPVNKVHWAYGDESWVECYSKPGWTIEDYIEVNWLKILIPSLPSEYLKIWDAVWDMQDARDDLGHGEVVTSFVLKIAENEENVNKDVAVISAILHDTGWSNLTKKERMLIFDKSIPKEERLKMRFKHQDKGVEIVKEVLTDNNFDTSIIDQVCEIVSEHDTRKGFLSSTEGAVRDADKLWRFQDYGFINDNIHSKRSYDKHIQYFEDYLKDEDFFYFDSSRKLAEQFIRELKDKFLEI